MSFGATLRIRSSRAIFAAKLRKLEIGICHNGSPPELFRELTNSAATTRLIIVQERNV